MKPIFIRSSSAFHIFCVTVLFSFCGALAGSDPIEPVGESLPSGSEIVRRNIEANGGARNLEDFHSFFAKGYVLKPGEEKKKFRTYRKRPSQVKMIMEDDPIETVVTFDGKSGLRQVLVQGREVERVEYEGDSLISLKRSSQFDGPVLQHRERPESIRAIAFDELDGEPAVRVEFLGSEDGDYKNGWVSTKHFQTIRLERTVAGDPEGGESIEQLRFLDMEKINGVYVAMRIESYLDGELVQEVHIEELRPNVGIFDSFFDRR